MPKAPIFFKFQKVEGALDPFEIFGGASRRRFRWGDGSLGGVDLGEGGLRRPHAHVWLEHSRQNYC